MPNTATASVLSGVSLDPDGTNNSQTVNVQVRKSSISGTVYADNNLNNSFDSGEGINGVTLTLTGTDSYGRHLPVGGTYPALTTTTAGRRAFHLRQPASREPGPSWRPSRPTTGTASKPPAVRGNGPGRRPATALSTAPAPHPQTPSAASRFPQYRDGGDGLPVSRSTGGRRSAAMSITMPTTTAY